MVLLRPLAAWLATMTLVTLAGVFVLSRTEDTLADRAIAVAVLAATAYAVVKVLRWWATRYVITQERVMRISGLLSVRVSSIPLSKVNDTTFSRSIWGRVLGFGDLTLESAAEKAGLSCLAFLPNPTEVYRIVTSLLAERGRDEPDEQPVRRWPGTRDAGADDTGPLPRFG